MKEANNLIDQVKIAQQEAKDILKDLETGKITKAQAAEMIVAQRQKIDQLFDRITIRITK